MQAFPFWLSASLLIVCLSLSWFVSFVEFYRICRPQGIHPTGSLVPCDQVQAEAGQLGGVRRSLRQLSRSKKAISGNDMMTAATPFPSPASPSMRTTVGHTFDCFTISKNQKTNKSASISFLISKNLLSTRVNFLL